jgi:hypothetical protein
MSPSFYRKVLKSLMSPAGFEPTAPGLGILYLAENLPSPPILGWILQKPSYIRRFFPEAPARCVSRYPGFSSGEDARAVSAVRRFIEQHGESRFSEILEAAARAGAGDETPSECITSNHAGFRRKTSEGWQYFIMAESWKSEICKGLDPNRATQAIHDAGFLLNLPLIFCR